MYKNINVEAEHNELILENSNGDKVIIPANKRNWVQQKLKEGCHNCIDSLVETLPIANNYAGDGSLFPNNPEPITLITPDKRKINTTTDSDFYRLHYNNKLIGTQNQDKSWNLTDEIYKGRDLPEVTLTTTIPKDSYADYRNQFSKINPSDKFYQQKEQQHNKEFYSAPQWAQIAVGGYNDKRKSNDKKRDEESYNQLQNDFIAEKLLNRTKKTDNETRVQWLQKFSPKELETIKNSKYNSQIEPSIWSKFEQGLLSIGNSGSPVQFKNENLTQEEAKKEDSPLNILQPLNIPSKMVQSTYKDNYSFKDALKGKQNNATVSEDLVTDPLNLVGLGIWGKLSKVNKFSKIEDAYTAVKGLSKEEAIAKLSDLPKLKQIPSTEYNNIEDIIKNFTAKSDIDKKNSLIIKEGDKYFKELNNSESLKRLKEFGEEYNIDLLDAYKKAEKRWDYNTSIGKHNKFQVAGDEVFKDDIVDAMGVSTLDPEGLMKTFLSLDKNVSKDLSENSINYINKKTDIRDYHTAVWHELSHDINKQIIGSSSKLQKEIGEIFIDDLSKLSNENILNAKNKANDLYKSNFEKSNTGRFRNNETVDEIAKDEFNYITKPTETWAFLSTNLRQDLKNTGLIKDYNQTLTSEILEQAIKNNNTVFSRFEPYIKDKDRFIKLFNKMTLSIAPAAIYLQQKNENKLGQ